MNDDHNTTLLEVRNAIGEFAKARDWMQYHDPKNLVMAIASEVGELAEHYRWTTNEQSRELTRDPRQAKEVASELADVLMFAFEFANVCEIDITTAISSKLAINEQRYPVEKARGSNKKYDQL